MFTARARSRVGFAAASAAAVMVLAACSGGGGGDGGGGESFDYLAIQENTVIREGIVALAEDQCSAEAEVMPVEVETLPQADVNQRVVLLASQNALPEMFVGSTAELQPGGVLAEDDVTVDLEAAMTDLGVMEDVLPAAVSTVKNIYGDRFVSLPFQFNIEGFFYNKEIFADLGLEEPQTWAEFLTLVETLDAAGIQPLVAAGTQSWTLQRYIGQYLFRSLGPDAFVPITSGEAKLTDPEYLEGIAETAALGPYFGPGLATMDIQTAMSQLLTGQAAMIYQPSSALAEINNEELNQVGADAFGFMPFPEVEGGLGNINQYAANAGAPTVLAADLYTEDVGSWLACIAENWGSYAMNNGGNISGFALNQPVDEANVPALTAELQQLLSEVDETVTWFGATFDRRAAQTAGELAVPLFTGQLSAEDFAKSVQDAIDAGE